MDDQFCIPSAQPLQSTIHSFWQTNRSISLQTETIIPKGVVEVIFNFSGHSKIEARLNNKQYQLNRCFINGFNTFPIQLFLPDRQIFFGVRFHPVAIQNIFGVPAGEFANLPVDLTLIDTSVNALWHQLIEEKNFTGRISIIANWVNRRCLLISRQDEIINHFLTNISHSIPSVTDLSKSLCYSSRHLLRKLHALTGMNTEELLVYKKFLLSIHLMHGTDLSLTQLAYCCQFADQSHFIRTFKSFACMTPGEYKKSKSNLEGHIYQNVR